MQYDLCNTLVWFSSLLHLSLSIFAFYGHMYSLCPPPPNLEGRGIYWFWCGSRWHPLSFPCIIFWTSPWILTKLAYVHRWKEGKSWLDFGYLDLIFKVTVALWLVSVSAVRFHFHALSPEPVDGFWPNLHRYIAGRRERVEILVALT